MFQFKKTYFRLLDREIDVLSLKDRTFGFIQFRYLTTNWKIGDCFDFRFPYFDSRESDIGKWKSHISRILEVGGRESLIDTRSLGG